MTDAPLEIVDVGPAEDRDLAWQKKARELELEALPTIRATAEKWAATLSGILTAVGIGALLEGPELFNKLAEKPEDISKGAISAAVVLALIATVAATYAAQGTSKRVFLPGSGTLRSFSHDAVERAVWALRVSRFLALFAVVATLVSGGVLMWGAEDKKTPSETTEISVEGCSGFSGAATGEAPASANGTPAFRVSCD